MSDLGVALLEGADEGIFQVAELLAERIREIGGERFEGYKSAKAIRIEIGHSRVEIDEWTPDVGSKVDKYRCPERNFVIAIVPEPHKRKTGTVTKDQIDVLVTDNTIKDIIVKSIDIKLRRAVGGIK